MQAIGTLRSNFLLYKKQSLRFFSDRATLCPFLLQQFHKIIKQFLTGTFLGNAVTSHMISPPKTRAFCCTAGLLACILRIRLPKTIVSVAFLNTDLQILTVKWTAADFHCIPY